MGGLSHILVLTVACLGVVCGELLYAECYPDGKAHLIIIDPDNGAGLEFGAWNDDTQYLAHSFFSGLHVNNDGKLYMSANDMPNNENTFGSMTIMRKFNLNRLTPIQEGYTDKYFWNNLGSALTGDCSGNLYSLDYDNQLFQLNYALGTSHFMQLDVTDDYFPSGLGYNPKTKKLHVVRSAPCYATDEELAGVSLNALYNIELDPVAKTSKVTFQQEHNWYPLPGANDFMEVSSDGKSIYMFAVDAGIPAFPTKRDEASADSPLFSATFGPAKVPAIPVSFPPGTVFEHPTTGYADMHAATAAKLATKHKSPQGEQNHLEKSKHKATKAAKTTQARGSPTAFLITMDIATMNVTHAVDFGSLYCTSLTLVRNPCTQQTLAPS